MKKILITGGNGNIAKIITNKLLSSYSIKYPSKIELNVLNINEIENYLNLYDFDILIHTARYGGRRTKKETADVVYNNLVMFENLIKFSKKFKMIINLDSAATYDRDTDILNRKEEEMNTIPEDFYGFSKYVIYQRSLNHKNLYNLRIFNIFHPNEEDNRFIKLCFSNSKNDTVMNIQDDKYFDFVYYLDCIRIF